MVSISKTVIATPKPSYNEWINIIINAIKNGTTEGKGNKRGG